jgi:hypothetical protein
VESSYECGIEPSGSIKCRETTKGLSSSAQLHGVNKAIMGPSNATILLLLFRCYCHNMFRSYDHHHATYISILSQVNSLELLGLGAVSNFRKSKY